MVTGSVEPRLWTPPLRPLNRDTSLGFAYVDWCKAVLGVELMPWQQWLAQHAMEVDEDGRFRFRTVLVLVARQNGKTFMLSSSSLWLLFAQRVPMIVSAAQSLDIAREAWAEAASYAESEPVLLDDLRAVRRANGQERIETSWGGVYRLAAATSRGGRGLSVDRLNIDELREHRDWKPWGALSKTTIARPNAQTWCYSNAGDDQSVVLNHFRDQGVAGSNETLGLFEWSAPDGCDLDDREAWAWANPSLGVRISEAAIKAALETDTPDVFRTEVLCQRVKVMDAAVDPGSWEACRDTGGTLERLRDDLHLFVDVAPDGRHVTVGVAAETEDGRVRVEVVAAWQSTRMARAELGPLLERVAPKMVGWFPSGPSAAIADVLTRAADRLDVPLVGYADAQAREASMLFADLVHTRRLIHPGDPLLDAHVSGAQRKQSGDGWRFARVAGGHVDAVYAVAGAAHSVAVGDGDVRYDLIESVG